MTDEQTTGSDEADPAQVVQPVQPAQAIAANPLDQFTFSIRHRVERPFAKGHYEGRLKLTTVEFIVSDTTLEGVIQQMVTKAESLLRDGWTVRA